MDVGATIKKFRKQSFLKQSDLADLLHVTPQAVSSWERNRTQPNMETIEHMCQIFHCKKSDFLDEAPLSDDYVGGEVQIEQYGSKDVKHPMDLTDYEYRMLLYIRALNQDKKDIIYEMLKIFNDKKDIT